VGTSSGRIHRERETLATKKNVVVFALADLQRKEPETVRGAEN
jgi:hypothetical protein